HRRTDDPSTAISAFGTQRHSARVSKRRDAPYRSGACRGWRKVKTTAWRETNRERWRFFEVRETQEKWAPQPTQNGVGAPYSDQRVGCGDSHPPVSLKTIPPCCYSRRLVTPGAGSHRH